MLGRWGSSRTRGHANHFPYMIKVIII
jgi:hypothetical protein